ncbi:MAG: hypothetical protein VKJ24_09480 [Synechococcales bacterium]|nr:hypothetical protein [Synechococcales bacterium]
MKKLWAVKTSFYISANQLHASMTQKRSHESDRTIDEGAIALEIFGY